MAKKVQSTIVYMQTGALSAAKTITAITKANPAVVSCAAHGFSNGDVIVITGVLGMEEVNNRAFVIDDTTDSPLLPNQFALKDIDSTNYGTFEDASPQVAQAQEATMSAIGEVRGVPSLGGSTPNDIDVTHLRSIRQERLAGIPGQENASFELWFDPSTANHLSLVRANEDLADRAFLVTQPVSWNLALYAQVSGLSVAGGDVNAAYSATVTLAQRGAGAWSTI
jgi:hypothetical protein